MIFLWSILLCMFEISYSVSDFCTRLIILQLAGKDTKSQWYLVTIHTLTDYGCESDGLDSQTWRI